MNHPLEVAFDGLTKLVAALLVIAIVAVCGCAYLAVRVWFP